MSERRRLRLMIEAESTIEIDEEKYQRFLADHEKATTIVKQQETIEGLVDGTYHGDPVTRDDMARYIGKEGGYEKYADTLVTAVLQVHCAKHDWWTDLDNKKVGGECMFCYQERKDAEAERKEQRERSRAV